MLTDDAQKRFKKNNPIRLDGDGNDKGSRGDGDGDGFFIVILRLSRRFGFEQHYDPSRAGRHLRDRLQVSLVQVSSLNFVLSGEKDTSIFDVAHSSQSLTFEGAAVEREKRGRERTLLLTTKKITLSLPPPIQQRHRLLLRRVDVRSLFFFFLEPQQQQL